MALKNTYYASKIYSDRKGGYITDYYLSRGKSFIKSSVNIRGELSSLDSITHELYLKWRVSFDKKDFFKQRDYEKISEALSRFGELMRMLYINNKTDMSVENCTLDLENKGFRKLKDFEEQAFLDAFHARKKR